MKKMVSLILLTGELLLTSGAEIYRVEETRNGWDIQQDLLMLKYIQPPQDFFLTLVSSSGHVFTRVRRLDGL